MTKEMDIDLEIEADEVAYIYLGTDKHNNLKNLDLPDSHPIRAITGLQEVVDKVGRTEDGAEVNEIVGVRVNGAPLDIAEDRTVDVQVPTSYGYYLDLDGNNGVISLKDRNGVVLSTIDTNLERIVESGRYDASTNELVLVLDDNTVIRIDASKLVDVYTADGETIVESGHVFALSTGSKDALKDSADHIADRSNPHNVTKDQVGLGNVDNTSDMGKPISTLMQQALNGKADDSAVVHTTGNETIAGEKTFTNVPYVSKEAPILVIKSTNENKTDPSNNANAECGIYISGSDNNNFGKFYSTLDSENTAITRMMAWSSYKASLEVINKADGTSYGTAPATKDAHPTNAIVTKDYLQSTIEQASLSKQPYVVAFDPAVAVTNATTCIKYQGHCASYTKPVMSDNVLNRGSWTDDEYLLKRMQYCTFRPDGTIKEVLYKNDLTKVWIKNYADGTPDTPIYANGELMEFCATQTQPSEIPSDATESSITTLDTMLVIPTLYTYGDERRFKVSYDPSQGSAEAHTLDGHVYKYEAIGVYLASNSSDGTTIMSVSDAEPLRNISRYAFRGKLVTKDQTNGKWKLFNYYDSRMFKLLAYLIGGSLNSQATFGAGVSTGNMGVNSTSTTDVWTRNQSTYTGKTNTVGMLGQSTAFTQKYDADKYGVYDNGNTTQVRQVKFLVEAPWGQIWQFADDTCNEPSTGRFYAGTNSASVIQQSDANNGVFFINQVANPTLMKPIFTFYDPTDGLPGLATEATGPYSSMLRTENEAWGMPVDTKGTSSTGTCDGFAMKDRSTEGLFNSIVGGRAYFGALCGVAFFSGVSTLSYSNENTGIRTCFLFD